MTTESTTLNRSLVVRKRTTFGLLLCLLMLPAFMFVHHSWAETSFLDYLLDEMGYILVVLGVLGRLWCTLYIGGRKHGELQTTGPYSLVRHPLYVSNLLLAIGIASLSENPLILALVVIYFMVQYKATIRYEEAALRETFPEAYEGYMAQTPCFVPNFRHVNFAPPDTINLKALRVELPRVLAFLAIIPFMDLLTLLHERAMLPYITFP